MPRFALLFHELPAGAARASHWDLLLEPPVTAGPATEPGLLWTWALAQNPLASTTGAGAPVVIAAERLPDHRRLYLDYQGPLSDGRGYVTRLDEGLFHLLENTQARLTAQLSGTQLCCHLVIEPPTTPTALARFTFRPQ